MKSETNENEKKNVKNFGMKNNKEIPWEADEQETKNADWPHIAGREINHARNLSPIKIAGIVANIISNKSNRLSLLNIVFKFILIIILLYL